MNQLQINFESERPTVSARELHHFLESDTPFRLWFPRMTDYGFLENIDYTPYEFVHPQNNQSTIDYQVVIDMAKEISMIQRTEKGKEVRRYFIEVEKEWNSPEKIMQRALMIANKEIGKLKLLNDELKPKADFFDQVADSKNAIDMLQVAKVLNIRGLGRNKIFEILRDEKILMSDNLPYQKYIDCGYFRTIEQKYSKNGETHINFKTLVYQKGLDFIRRLVSHYE